MRGLKHWTKGGVGEKNREQSGKKEGEEIRKSLGKHENNYVRLTRHKNARL